MVRTSSKSEKQSAPVSVSSSVPVVAPTENAVVSKVAAPKKEKKDSLLERKITN